MIVDLFNSTATVDRGATGRVWFDDAAFVAVPE